MNIQLYSKRNRILALPIIYFLIANVYFSFGRLLVNIINISNTVSLYLIYVPTLVLIIFSFKYISRKSILYLILFETFFIFAYAYSYLTGRMEVDIILQYTVSTLVICIPFAILVTSMDNLNQLYTGLVKASYWNILLIFVYFMANWNNITYSMPLAYQLLFIAVIHVNELFSNKNRNKAILLCLIILEVLLILIKGSRGPLFILFIYGAIKVFTNIGKNKKVLIFSLFIGTLALVILINLSEILNLLSAFLQNNNIYSRNLALLLNNNLLDDSGRSELHKLALDLIGRNPIFGYGPSSDVKLLGGAYVHSFYLELFINYGLILGFAIFTFITFESIRALFVRPGINKDLLLIFVVLGYLMLMISSTYLQNIYLFLFIGLIIRRGTIPEIVGHNNFGEM